MGYEQELKLASAGGNIDITTDGVGLLINGTTVALSTSAMLFGAKGDGVTDNTAAIKAAVAFAKPIGNPVSFSASANPFVSGPFTLPASVVLDGAGVGGTTLKLKAGANADFIVTEGFSGFTGTSASGPSKFGIQNMTIDANGANQTTTARCFVAYGFGYTVRNARFVNGRGGCVYSEWGGTDNPSEAIWSDVKCYGWMGDGSVGMDWNGPHDTKMSNIVLATLDSSIHTSLGSYGTTPINGSTLTVPSNSANGGAGSFTFATTTAADTTNFPTGGGVFLVPTVNSTPTYVMIKYTSAATVSTVTTFSGCTTASPTFIVCQSAGTFALPSYALRLNGATSPVGEPCLQVSNLHIWGRNHFGIYPASQTTTYLAGNCQVEGCFVANVVLGSNSNFTGAVFGTNGQAGQTNESGIQLGSADVHAQSCSVFALCYNLGGASSTNGSALNSVNSSSGNSIKLTGATGNPNQFVKYVGGPNDYIDAVCQNNQPFSFFFDNTTRPYRFVQARNGRSQPTYSASIAPNLNAGPWATITVTNATAFSVITPSPNDLGTADSVMLTIEILNSSGGAMGTLTWGPAFTFAGQTWANPANTKKRFATFAWNGATWVCLAMATADY